MDIRKLLKSEVLPVNAAATYNISDKKSECGMETYANSSMDL